MVGMAVWVRAGGEVLVLMAPHVDVDVHFLVEMITSNVAGVKSM